MAKQRKAGKTTGLGLNKEAVSALKAYRDSLPAWFDSPYLFIDEAGQPLTRMAIYHRLKRLGNRAGIAVHPHALRRAFVTINANKGRPLQMLQMACGHSSIKTTMDYCRTSEQEMISAISIGAFFSPNRNRIWLFNRLSSHDQFLKNSIYPYIPGIIQ